MKIEEFPKITVILRGYNYDQVRLITELLVKYGIKSLEITMNTENAFEIIKKIKEEFGKKIFIGAGTVINMENTKEAVKAGAEFILSPIMLEKEILEYCKSKEVLTVPGAFSPTEITESLRNGADIVKIFPAERLGSKYISDITAPLGELPLMVVGGINKNNVNDYFKKGAKYAGIASGIFEKEDILNEDREKLENTLKSFINNLEI
ncbi:bifunctional 4-hydroxy-2-oxoglutarate aldolase/2-dehydro-3-deoxy-phosphogluconate aldolase [Pseudoleptotrichia goodfellowii]|jgi:2-dehydro-3-deoxyphosphogluconate aldolase/4-hydroxy-2-oxoglutarate aldolase|uniref:KDPG and KHG aldolase n=1 Tax=Pseudoleptotrichia goodfellowii F0264 TaxID=596323 RepID=D0GPK4_9FUSO|nr:bifunctional 4-hydroxy-2-oxoglutarate aldolase/2-dehydro-3-deoxy-phosphogluconate aldolase [Pseudoleptotrichia goodfellowii]EEY33958.1 KDPG and KHG aldolase [Pseudoleptotrichia goodfellowii F0264]